MKASELIKKLENLKAKFGDKDVIEPKVLSLDMIINAELRRLSNHGLSLRSKCQAIHNTIKRYKEKGYTFKRNFS